MKKIYVAPELVITLLETEAVLAGSGDTGATTGGGAGEGAIPDARVMDWSDEEEY